VNEIGQRIYDLNIQIQKVEAGGIETAMTMRDERDQLLDELGTYGTIEVKEDASGFTYVDFEHVRFVDDIKCFTIGLQQDKTSGTGFYTPYWEHMSDEEAGKYVNVFDVDEAISTDVNTDVGGIKSKLIARGDMYGRYENMAEDEVTDPNDKKKVLVQNYDDISKSTMVEIEAELDNLFHEIVTTINDIFAPKKELDQDTLTGTYTDEDGNTQTGTFNSEDWVELDVANCTLGADGELPEDLFVRSGKDNYYEVTDDNGETHYLYRKEKWDDDSTRYAIGNVTVNANYQRAIASMPAFTANGGVDMDFGSSLRAAWEAKSMYLNPTDNNPCTYEEYYNKMVDNLAVKGNTYMSATDTLEVSVASYDSQRQQVMGVSSDEELTNMIKYQAAYNAASRYMTVISEMTELIVTGLI
jgi:flagellar hook-associated protein 1 FlgK